MKRFLILVLIIGVFFGVPLVLAGHGGLPSVGWTSGQQIQNIGSEAGDIYLVAYNSLGYRYTCPEKQLNFGESHTYLSDEGNPMEVCLSDDVGTGDMLAIPSGFSGSGIVFGNQPLAGIINIHNKGFGRAAGQYNATSVDVVDTTISFPLVKNNHEGRTTTFYIQNASDTENTITATFKMNGEPSPFTTSFPNVKPYARVILQPGDVVTPTSLNIGSLIITGTQDLAGISLEHPTDAPMITGLQASRAFAASDHGTTLYCPLLRHGWAGAETTTGLQVQNVGNQATNITVIYTEITGTVTTEKVTAENIAVGASKNFLQSNHFDTQTLASAVITSTEDVALVAIVSDRANGTNPKRYFHYGCFKAGIASTTVSLPLVKEHFYGNTSGIQVQNTGTISTHLVLTYTTGYVDDENEGNLSYVISTISPVGPGASKTIWNITAGGTEDIIITPIAPATNTLPLMTSNNGVIIRSVSWDHNPAQPIVAIAVESTEYGANPQDSKAYEGVNIDD
jgi:hypothetical protein